MQFAEHLGQVDILHVYVSILEVLVEGLQFIVEREVVQRQLEELVSEVLEQQRSHVLLGIGRDLELLVVKAF